MNPVATTRGNPSSASVLTRLAERWRPVGLFLACLDREGTLFWQDPQMPRAFALCLTTDSGITQQIKRMGEAVTPDGVRLHGHLPWIQLHLLPILKRRKVTGWIVMVGRTDHVAAGSEELARFAHRAAVDAQVLATSSNKAPLVPPPLFTSLVRMAEQMHEDLQAGSVAHNELANVTEQLTSVYEEISLLYKISSGMRFSQKPQAFLETVCRELKEIGDFRGLMVALSRRSGEKKSVADINEVTVSVGDWRVDGED